MQQYKLEVWYISDKLKLDVAVKLLGLKVIEQKKDKVVLKVDKMVFIIVYSFGSICFFNVKKEVVDKIISKFIKSKIYTFRKPISDSYEVVVDHKIKEDIVEFYGVKIPALKRDKIDIISSVVAQSVALDYYNQHIEKVMEELASINKDLQKLGRLKIPRRELIKKNSELSNVISDVIMKTAILEKPAISWEYPNLEELYEKLRSMFELDITFKNLKFKVDYISNELSRLLEIKRSVYEERLEIIIILLIALEVALWVYEFVKL